MSVTPHTTEGRHGLIGFRLSEIPHPVRRQVGDLLIRLAREEMRLAEAVALERAVEFPSDTLHWIPRTAYESATQRKRWRS